MKNKHYFTKALFATTAIIFFSVATAVAQCTIPIPPGQSYIEDFQSGDTFSFAYAMMALYPPYDELTVSYRTSPSDSWHQLVNYSISDWSNTYDASFTIDDMSSTFQVSFLGHSNGGYYIFVDDIEIASAGGCARPAGLTASEITTNSALLGWSTAGNEESWTIDINGQQTTVTSQPYVIDRLEPNTDYSFRVKANCGGGMESEWSQPTTFKTMCEVFVVTDDEPYFDDFEASEEFVCWRSEIISGEDDWVVDPGYLIPNNTAFFIWLGEEAMLVSAPLDITAVTEVTFDLPEASDAYLIAFKAKSNEADGVYVDDVRVGNYIDDGVEEVASFAESVSPNPTSGIVTIASNSADGEVTVMDLFGRKVASAIIHEGRTEVDLSSCAKGVYMARISSEAGTRTIKLVKE